MTTRDPDVGSRLVAALVLAGEQVKAAKTEALRPFWECVIAADRRLARLCDNHEWRAEIETRIEAWRTTIEGGGFASERSRPEVVALAVRVRGLDEEMADLFNEVRALGRVSVGGELEGPVGALMLSLAAAFDALAPAVAAAQELMDMPEKAGGPGSYTANLRKKPVKVFGEAMVPIFRLAGIPLGGNSSRDKAFAAFIAIAADYVTGAPIPSLAGLLADLRKL